MVCNHARSALGGDRRSVARMALPADPLHTLAGDKTVDASLGYSMTFSPDESRLFVARQALGALWAWQGNATVDVVVTATDAPLAPARGGQPYGSLTTEILHTMGSWDQSGAIARMTSALLDQPPAMVYRKKTHQL